MSLETESRYRLNSESSSVACTRRTDSFKRSPIETINSEIALAVVLVIFDDRNEYRCGFDCR